jgi:endonuclease YncB( thermonuclease family)
LKKAGRTFKESFGDVPAFFFRLVPSHENFANYRTIAHKIRIQFGRFSSPNKDYMQKLSTFWKQDFVNKLIVIISVFLVLGVSVIVALLFLMPAGKSGAAVIGEIFPTRTLEPRMVLTHIAESVLTQSAAATASVPPTITTMPFTPFVKSPTPESGSALELIQASPSPTATSTLPAPTATLSPSSTPTLPTPIPTKSIVNPTSATLKPTSSATSQIGSAANLACIPANPSQKGKVVDVLDGNTIKVLINGLAYVVRYIGIDIPANPNYAKLAAITNGDLVFAKEVTLIPDVTDKDANGRLLRYVKIGDQFPSIELLEKGLATAIDTPPNSACARTYQSTEQAARESKTGIWMPIPTLPVIATP